MELKISLGFISSSVSSRVGQSSLPAARYLSSNFLSRCVIVLFQWVGIPDYIMYKEVIQISISSGGQKAGGAEEEGEGEEEGGGEKHQEEKEGECPTYTFF
jgi:hypothetical protein